MLLGWSHCRRSDRSRRLCLPCNNDCRGRLAADRFTPFRAIGPARTGRASAAEPSAFAPGEPAAAPTWRKVIAVYRNVKRPFSGSCQGLNFSSTPSLPDAFGKRPVRSHTEKACRQSSSVTCAMSSHRSRTAGTYEQHSPICQGVAHVDQPAGARRSFRTRRISCLPTARRGRSRYLHQASRRREGRTSRCIAAPCWGLARSTPDG